MLQDQMGEIWGDFYEFYSTGINQWPNGQVKSSQDDPEKDQSNWIICKKR